MARVKCGPCLLYRYGSTKAGLADAWDHMVNGFSNAYKSLAKAWETSEKEFSPKE